MTITSGLGCLAIGIVGVSTQKPQQRMLGLISIGPLMLLERAAVEVIETAADGADPGSSARTGTDVVVSFTVAMSFTASKKGASNDPWMTLASEPYNTNTEQ